MQIGRLAALQSVLTFHLKFGDQSLTMPTMATSLKQ